MADEDWPMTTQEEIDALPFRGNSRKRQSDISTENYYSALEVHGGHKKEVRTVACVLCKQEGGIDRGLCGACRQVQWLEKCRNEKSIENLKCRICRTNYISWGLGEIGMCLQCDDALKAKVSAAFSDQKEWRENGDEMVCENM